MKKYEMIAYTDTKALILPDEYLETLSRAGVDLVSGQCQTTKEHSFHVNVKGLSYSHTETTVTAYSLRFKE
jgi:hypothetical protein